MAERLIRRVAVIVVIVVLLGIGWAVGARLIADAAAADAGDQLKGDKPPVAVEVSPITVGDIAERLVVSGSLTPSAQFVVAPEVGGRLVELAVDIGDEVEHGAVVARLDDRDYRRAVAEAEAAVAVAKARKAEAESALGVTRRAAERAATLVERGVAAEAERDRTEAAQLAAEAAIAVAAAELQQAQAQLESAEVTLTRTAVIAHWDGDDASRIVGERWVDVGETLSAGHPIASVIDLSPLHVEIHVTEAAYGRIAPGQAASLRVDAWPDERFAARVDRIAPRFAPASRQALVRLVAPNEDGRLKPGMYVRAELELERRSEVTLVPEAALVGRRGEPAVFVVSEDGTSVHRVPVTVGLREGDRIEVGGEGLTGRVVTLGHHLLSDGGAITIADHADGAEEAGP